METVELRDDLDEAEVVADEAPSEPGKRRKKSSMSPTRRTLLYLRKEGCQLVAITEHWNAWAGIRQDLFGIIDVLAIKDDQIIAVQCCASSGVSKRVDKIAEAEFKNPETGETCHTLSALLTAKIKVYVFGWSKLANGRWQLRKVDLS
jgi:hypothetical protein